MHTVSQSTLSKRPRLDSATYSLAELAGLFGVSYTSLQEQARAGKLPVEPIRVGRQYRFPRAVVDRLLGIDADASRDVA